MSHAGATKSLLMACPGKCWLETPNRWIYANLQRWSGCEWTSHSPQILCFKQWLHSFHWRGVLFFSLLVDKIDTDNDGHVTEGELQAWIKYIQRRYITEDSERQWVNYDKQPGDTMTWSEYLEKTFPEGLEHGETAIKILVSFVFCFV